MFFPPGWLEKKKKKKKKKNIRVTGGMSLMSNFGRFTAVSKSIPENNGP